MILNIFVGVMIFVGAGAIGALEYAMSPQQKRFPCVHPWILYSLRLHTLCLVFTATDRLYRVWLGEPIDVTIFQAMAATSMAVTYACLYGMVLRLRLNEGVWPRLQARWRRVDRLNKLGGHAGAVLARAAADAPPDVSAVASVATLEKLARMK